MTRFGSSPNFSDFLTVGQAAQVLGVSTATLRNWDRSGKLKPRRHPQNGYRIYLHEDLAAVLRSVDSPTTVEGAAPTIDWSQVAQRDHFVQFYETDEFLVESVSGYVAAGLKRGDGSVVIATADHRIAVQRKLVACGVDVAGAIEGGRYVVLDAADTLAKLMANGSPDPRRFREVIGPVIAQVSDGGRPVRAFGEMVALLWAEGNRDAAIRLEQLWNELGKVYAFALFCAYPMGAFGERADAELFNGICECHSRAYPTESYLAIGSTEERLRAITVLQQKAQSLESEVERRVAVENALSQRERQSTDVFDNTQGPSRAGREAGANGTAKKRILVVDDNNDAGRTLGILLKLDGHEVRTARDGLEAVELAADFAPEVILMDVSMPKLNGYEATRRIREMPGGENIFIVALTGWGRPDDHERSAEAGCSAHLVKPVVFADLQKLLANALPAR